MSDRSARVLESHYRRSASVSGNINGVTAHITRAIAGGAGDCLQSHAALQSAWPAVAAAWQHCCRDSFS